MAAAVEEIDDDELQRRVLQSTLDEVAAAHPEEECCVICLDVISDPCELVPCGHCNFDLSCAKTWFAAHTACPLCKRHVERLLHGACGVDNRPVVQVVANPAADTSGFASISVTPLSLQRDRWEWRGRDDETRRVRRTRWPDIATMFDLPRELGPDVQFRRQIYADNLFSMHVGCNRLSQYQELTPDMFRRDEQLVSRARMFIRRELQVFSFLSHREPDPEFAPIPLQPGPGRLSPSHWRPPSVADSTTAQPGQPSQRRAHNAEFLLEYIVSILKSVDVMGSMGAARDMLADFLGQAHARLFLHELRAWLRSPYTRLEDWDRVVQYPTAEQQQQDEEREERRRSDHWRPDEQRGESSHDRGPRAAPQQKGDYYRPGGANMDRWLQSTEDEPGGRTDVHSLELDHQRHLHSVRDYRH